VVLDQCPGGALLLRVELIQRDKVRLAQLTLERGEEEKGWGANWMWDQGVGNQLDVRSG
jgi:hypothetical protein